MAMYGSNSIVVAVDNSSGTPVTMTNYITSINAVSVEAILQETTAFGDAWQEQIQQMGGEKAVEEQADDKDPSAGFDTDQVLRDGVVSWSAKEPVTPDNLADLEEATSTFLVRKILTLSNVAVTADDKKAQAKKRKNG